MLTKKAVNSYLFQAGIQIRKDALEFLMKYMEKRGFEEHALEEIVDKLRKFQVVDIEELRSVFLDALKIRNNTQNYIAAIDVFEDLPKYFYEEGFEAKEPGSMFAAAEAKSFMYRQRFSVIQDRILKNPDYSFELSTIDSLVGSSGEKIVLGMLSKIDGENWYLEDLNSSVKLVISEIDKNTGFYCEGCVVLVQGVLVDTLFYVSCFIMPSLAKNPESFFGDQAYIEKHKGTDQVWELEWPEASFIVVLSNVHLNEPRVLRHLEKLFEGLEHMQQILFVLMGNFCSESEVNPYSYKDMFTSLVNTIENYESLKENAQWVFVPGPKDPGLGNFMPRQKLGDCFTFPLKSLKRWKFCSNPARVHLGGKKLVFARTEQLRLLMRNSAVLPNYQENPQPESHLAHTLVKQGHLCPSSAVLPDFDSALWLDSEVEVLCLGENCNSFCYEVDEVKVANPGHFSRYANFISITANLEVQMCSLDN